MHAGPETRESLLIRFASSAAIWACGLGICLLMVDMAVSQLGTMDSFGPGAVPMPAEARRRIGAAIQMAAGLDLLACAALGAAGIAQAFRKRVSMIAAFVAVGAAAGSAAASRRLWISEGVGSDLWWWVVPLPTLAAALLLIAHSGRRPAPRTPPPRWTM